MHSTTQAPAPRKKPAGITLAASSLASKVNQRLFMALQRALSSRECAYLDKRRERGTLSATTCAEELLCDVQLGGSAHGMGVAF